MADFQPDLASLDRVFAQIPVQGQTPADWQQQAARTQAAQALAQERQAKAQEAAETRADEAALRELARKHGGDVDKIHEELTRTNPAFAAKFAELVGQSRKAGFDAVKAQNEVERQAHERDLVFLEAAAENPAAYPVARARILKRDPDMASLLPEQYDPVAVSHALKSGQTLKDVFARRDQSIQWAVEGKWAQSLAMALDDPEVDTQAEWDEVLKGQRNLGAPPAILAQFGAFDPDPARRTARLRQMGMTPAQRASAAAVPLSPIVNAQGERVWATREQAVGQPVGTAGEGALVRVVGPGGRVTWASREDAEGQPAPVAAPGSGGDNSPLQAIIGPDGKPVLVRRNEAVGKQPATASMGAGGDGSTLPPRVETTVRNLAGAFRGEAAVKRAVTMGEAVSFVNSLDMQTTNPADDQALIYAFAKAMDPESVVREGEYATVAKYAQSWLQQFGFDAMRVLSSNTPILTPQARANLKKTITGRFNASRGTYDNLVRSYVGQINKATGGDDGMERLTDYGAVFPPAPPASTSAPSGTKRRDIKGGGVAELRDGKWIRVQ